MKAANHNTECHRRDGRHGGKNWSRYEEGIQQARDLVLGQEGCCTFDFVLGGLGWGKKAW